jgi:hypothetical protein
MGDEALGGELRTVEIPWGEPRAAYVYFAGNADGDKLPIGIEEVHLIAADPRADRRPVLRFGCRAEGK